jgi:hypothetical protein
MGLVTLGVINKMDFIMNIGFIILTDLGCMFLIFGVADSIYVQIIIERAQELKLTSFIF